MIKLCGTELSLAVAQYAMELLWPYSQFEFNAPFAGGVQSGFVRFERGMNAAILAHSEFAQWQHNQQPRGVRPAS
jgi:hypothetical protein